MNSPQEGGHHRATSFELRRTHAVRIIALLFATLAAFAGCATIPDEQRIDNLPMYGQPGLPRPKFAQRADEEFIKQAAAGFGGNREAASKAWAMQAENYMRAGNLHYAMRRYNQSWLLNPNSYLPYWGFGRVMVARRKLEQAVEYFEKAKQVIDEPYQKPALLTDTGTAYSYLAESLPSDRTEEKAKYFKVANEHFQDATALDPSYATGWKYWAFALFRETRYADAWDKVKQTRARGGEFTKAFITDLEQKMPEPK